MVKVKMGCVCVCEYHADCATRRKRMNQFMHAQSLDQQSWMAAMFYEYALTHYSFTITPVVLHKRQRNAAKVHSYQQGTERPCLHSAFVNAVLLTDFCFTLPSELCCDFQPSGVYSKYKAMTTCGITNDHISTVFSLNHKATACPYQQ